MAAKQWFPLESNPTVMNSYMRKLGLNTESYSFHDVFSTEDWALEMVPRPVLGLLMLFPISQGSEEHRKEEEQEIKTKGQVVSEKVYYMKQTIGNACGTVGLLHAVGNISSTYPDAIRPGTYLDKFYSTTTTMSPDSIAEYLEDDEELEETHVEAADEGQSEQVEDANDVDNHFICFSHVDGCIYELDGRKAFPINHGACAEEEFLEHACKIVQGFMNRNPGDLRFTIVAFCKAPPAEGQEGEDDDEQEGDGEGDDEEEEEENQRLTELL